MQFVSIRAGIVRELDRAPSEVAADEFVWCDCAYEEARDWVAPVGALTGATVIEEHLLDAENRHHPSYFDSTHDYEMIVFRGVQFGAAAPDEGEPIRVGTRPVTFFVFPRCLVTVRAADSRTFASVREKLLAPAGAVQRLPRSPEGLAMRLLSQMIDRYLELRQPLTERLERWQRLLLDPRRPFRDWLALLEARAELRKLEQLCEEQLDALQGWRDVRAEREEKDPGEESPSDPRILPLSDAQLVRLRDLVEHIERVLRHAQRLQDAVETAVDLHFSSTAHRTNEIMRTLTTITAIFLPLTLITGIFGMNFEFIPGMHSRNGFWVALGAMAVIAIVLFAFLRARRLIDTPRRRGNRRGARGTR